MHFKYEYSIEGHLVSKYLYGNNDNSLKWHEFYKYYSNGNLMKIIRFDPSKVNPENKIDGVLTDPNNMPWGETFSYNESGSVQDHKEFYGGYILESTIFDIKLTCPPVPDPTSSTALFLFMLVTLLISSTSNLSFIGFECNSS